MNERAEERAKKYNGILGVATEIKDKVIEAI